MSATLLPCPFCGGEASQYPDGDMEGYSVSCWNTACGTMSMDYPTATEAAEAWNRRAPGWIAVADALPIQDGLRCAVIAPGAAQGERWPAIWDAKFQSWEAGGGWFELAEVTHWMPLPDAPTSPKLPQT